MKMANEKIGHHATYWDGKSMVDSWGNTWQAFIPEIKPYPYFISEGDITAPWKLANSWILKKDIKFNQRDIMPILLREVQYTFSGEVGHIVQGSPVLLIRIQGCNLPCPWCDAKGTQDFEHGLSVDHRVLAELMYNSAFPILLTGGEPLLHSQAILKAFELLATKYNVNRVVQIETNGSIAIDPDLFEYATFVVDYKFKYEDQMRKDNWDILTNKDFIKILVTDQDDVNELEQFIAEFSTSCKARLAVSCTDNQLYKEVCDLVLDNKWPIIVNVQIHKLLGIA